MLRSSFTLFAAVLLAGIAVDPGWCQDGTWQTLPRMSTRREGLGAATGPDGRVYAVGGYNSYGFMVGDMEAFDPLTGAWGRGGGMITPRRNFACLRGPDGRIYSIGGLYGSTAAEAYDTSTGQSIAIASLPINPSTEQVNGAAVGNDGRIYALVMPQSPASFPEYLRAYNVATNTWSPAIHAPFTLPYGWSGIASDSAGNIVIAGGLRPDNSPVADAFMFNARANAWRSIQPLPSAVGYLTLVLAGNGRLYAMEGGASYDPTLNSWTAESGLNAFGSAVSAITMGPDGRLYLLGGLENSSEGFFFSSDSAMVYQPALGYFGPNVTSVNIQGVERVAFTGIVGSFTDSRSTNAADFAASIQWGDGQTTPGLVSANGSGGFNVTGSHSYTNGGAYTTRVTVSAVGGFFGFSNGSAVVTPQLAATGLTIVSKSKSYTGPVANFTDLHPSLASAYKATIQWGDGRTTSGTVQAKAGGGFTVSGKHSYSSGRASYMITVTISKAGVSPATATSYFSWTG